MDKKVGLSLLTLAIFLGAVQGAEPVAAGTLFDSGKWADYSQGTKMTTHYKAYYGNGQIYILTNSYIAGKRIATSKSYLRKIDYSTIKIYLKVWVSGSAAESESGTDDCTGTATSYYWNVAKPDLKNSFTNFFD